MMTKFKGFTLVELMVGMGTLIVITTVVLGIWVSGIQNFSLINFTQAREASFFDTYDRIDNNVRIATSFPASYLDTSTNTTYTAGANTLIVALHAVTASGAICAYTDTVVYNYSGNTLTELVFPDANSSRVKRATPIGQNISTLTFTQSKATSDHRIVTLSVTNSKLINRETITSTHTQSMVALND
jgi:hypothetical protein